jgi:hypothetical protein
VPPARIPPVARHILATSIILILGGVAAAQQPSQPPPKVKVNVLNVCSPSAEEQKEIASALGRVPRQPLFGVDFEVDRGKSSLEEPPGFLQPGSNVHVSPDSAVATWVRIRREFAVQALFSTVQYSFSLDAKDMVETLVFHVRDPKDLMELSIEDSASSVTRPDAMLTSDTPASHIKLERFGKSSVVLARCSATDGGPPPDQSGYEPLFQSATSIVANYRRLLDAPRTVPDELSRMGAAEGTKTKPNSKLRRAPQPQK